MKKRKFHANIAGRVAKIKTQDFLVPLYEAISNSIHSIEDSARNGTIEIEFLREPRQMELSGAARQRELPITGFIVTDTGLGFTEANVESFCEADSTSKATVGGKGVARFSWLKFFERATVESVYSEVDGKKYRRTFTFSTTGVDGEDVVEVNAPFRTRIQLGPLRLAYELKTRKTLEDIAISIIEQFLAYLSQARCRL